MSRRARNKKVNMFNKTPRNHVSRLLAGMLLSITALAASTTSEPDVVVLRAALGRNAHLPCGQGRVFLDGPDAFVMWFDFQDKFLYRFPNEDTEMRSTSVDRVCVEGFCYDNTSLLVERASFEHIGRYRCRIHYQSSSAADFYVELRLVQAPAEPRLYDDNGDQIKKSYVGPMALGDTIHLVCEVQDDQPRTVVYWKRNGVALEKAQTVSPGVLRTAVRIENATRNELDANYECLVQNADVTDPLIVGVVVKMNLPPLSVEIRMNKDQDFEAGQPRVVDCVVIGCVPPPTVTWHLGDKTLRSNVHKELHNGNYTVSTLTLAPSMSDSGRELVCRAHNANMEDQVFEDRVKVTVGYRPYCVSPSREEWVGVMAGEAEAVFCLVDASPAPVQFSWTFADSRTLTTKPKKVSGYKTRYSTGLTWLPHDTDLGLLQCRAINSIGEQVHACMYNVAKGGPPKPPRCFMQTDDPLEIQCKKDWNGGRPQTIHLELYSAKGTLLHNVTDVDGHFKFPESLDKDSDLSAVVYASSIRGRSETRTIRLQVFRQLYAGIITAPTSSDETPAPEPFPVTVAESSWVQWLKPLGWAATILIIMNLLYFLVRVVCSYRGPRPGTDPDLIVNSTNGSFHREPDVTRDDRVAGTTNITLNQVGTCQNDSTARVQLNNVARACSQQCMSPQSPPPPCRVLRGCAQGDAYASVLSYYV